MDAPRGQAASPQRFACETPPARAQLLAGRTLALAVNLALLGLTIYAVALAGAALVGADLDAGRLGFATAQVTLLAWLLGALALAVGSASGRPGLASGVAFAVTLAGYLVHSLSPQVAALRHLRPVSPFWYAIGESPFREVHPVNAPVLLLAGLAFVLLAVPTFLRRDVGH